MTPQAREINSAAQNRAVDRPGASSSRAVF
jgi:hypothetical protein